MHRMYLWKLVGNNASQDRMLSGVGDDLPAIMRKMEGDLLDGSAFVARVYEVVFRVSVADLSEIHVPTGREWHGRRDSHGGVHWSGKLVEVTAPDRDGHFETCPFSDVAGEGRQVNADVVGSASTLNSWVVGARADTRSVNSPWL